ncbi:MAG TPA: sulfurtransferase TusA family protein, partial [Dermatophilaceae bacterium]|nr:sulfurtransferase TusA family protein [Dermatophilaceae bacterium]
TVIVVLAGDPAARHDIPAWCRMRDHELLETTETRDATGASEPSGPDETDGAHEAEAAGKGPAYLRFVVLIRPQRSKAGGSGKGSERSSRAR